jgi:uncharacterized protein (DUF302 family)
MTPLSFTREITGTLDEGIARATQALASEGFGILTRMDVHLKIQEKLGKTIPATVILGACHPGFAYQGLLLNRDLTALLPCNAVVREVGAGRFSIEFVMPSVLLQILGDAQLDALAREGDAALARALERL